MPKQDRKGLKKCCLDFVVLYVFPVHFFFCLVNYYVCFMSRLFHCVDICYLNNLSRSVASYGNVSVCINLFAH